MKDIRGLLNDKAAISEHIIEDRLGPLLEETFKKWHGDDSKQEPTPLPLILDMISRVGKITGEVLVVSNVDVFMALQQLRDDPRIQQDMISTDAKLTLLTDTDIKIPVEIGSVKKVDNLNEPAKIDMMGKKFDVVIGNPPYNDGDSLRSAGSQKHLAKEFVNLMLKLSNRFVAVVTPYSDRTFNEKTRESYVSKGLYKVNKSNHFPNVSQNIGVFFFDKETTSELIDEWTTAYTSVSRPLADIYHTVPGRTKQEVEHALKASGEQGAHRFVLTTSDIRYTDDESIIGKESDRTFGTWRVAVPWVYDKRKIGKPIVVLPTDTVSHNVGCFVVGSEEEADKLVEHMLTEEFTQKMDEVKFGATNSKKFFKVVETPEFIK